ncbi:MAG: ferritin-like domain-containing protein [Gemmatimonadota bacterium]|jgi:hypothetical protein|nr:ferritin-like domain-containing protein [Gemmatimonadota bacterium]
MAGRTYGGEEELGFLAQLTQATNRRKFLKWSGVSVGVMVAGCSDSSDGLLNPAGDTDRNHEANPLFLGVGDEAVLNYAYVLEQLEAAFFVQVISRSSSVLGERERLVINDLRKHELIHREFYDTAIPALGFRKIPELTFTFASVDFTSRQSILQTSAILEDLGVSAYNGAVQLVQNVAILQVAGKIASNEARHASAVRDLLDRAGFAGANTRRQFFEGRMASATITESTSLGTATVMVNGFGQPNPGAGVLGGVLDQNGLDRFRVPTEILPLAAPFIVGAGNIDASGLPTPAFTG